MNTLISKITSLNEYYIQKFNKQHGQTIKTKFVLNGSGCRQKVQFMQLPTFRIAVCIGLLALYEKTQFSIMVTASHNSSAYNGIKIGYTNGNIMQQQKFKIISNCLNNQQQFIKFINLYYNQTCSKQLCCFVGRDCRTSSPQLSKITCQTLKLFGIQVVDIGVCTTPQLYSFSKYITQHQRQKQNKTILNNQKNLKQLKQKYVSEVMQAFTQTYKKLSNHKKLNILLDFSNGSGSISFSNYKPYLLQFFNITQAFNTDFTSPNEKCGAHYFYQNWNKVIEGKQFVQFDECFFFDGDSDRIIAKVQNQKIIFDGNYFMVYYLRFLKEAIGKLKQDGKLNSQDLQSLKLHGIGTIVMNLGTKKAVQKMGVSYFATDVGTINLNRQAIKNIGISVCFQPNGHGGIYYSKEAKQTIQKLFNLHRNNLQLLILSSFYKILQNNSKGYGLHNMLTYYLVKNYLQIKNISSLLTLTHEASKNCYIDQKYEIALKDKQFLVQIHEFISEINKNPKFQQYQTILRKSATQKCLLRVFSQGIDQNICIQIIGLIENKMRQLGYFQKK